MAPTTSMPFFVALRGLLCMRGITGGHLRADHAAGTTGGGSSFRAIGPTNPVVLRCLFLDNVRQRRKNRQYCLF